MTPIERGSVDRAANKHAEFRTSRRALARAAVGTAGAGALAMAGAAALNRTGLAQEASPVASPVASAPGQSAVSVFPSHGTVTASPATEITFRGVVSETLGAVEVYGSESGLHSGYLETHRDRGGASFVVDADFQPGETVTVSAGLPIGLEADGSLTFTVSRPAPSALPRGVDPDEPPGAELLTFRTRPDIQIPRIDTMVMSEELSPGYLVVAPRVENGASSAMIVDNNGDAVWAYLPDVLDYQVLDVRVQQYQGSPVVTWWEGASPLGYGYGHFVMVDSSYQQVARVQVGNGFYGGDIHEFLLTDRGTALVLIYHPIFWDLTPVGGVADGAAHDGILQEIDIETGRVYFEWHSLDHVAIDETHREPQEGVTLDYFHANSGEIDTEGNYLVSARHTDAIYKVDGGTGEVIWRLNGAQSDFEMGEGTPFRLQHDARVHPDGYLSLFDNATENADSGIQSRGMVLDLDEEEMTATLVREYLHPEEIVSVSQANTQVLPNGNVFVGWGSAPVSSEFTEDGELLFDARFPSGVNSYRAYREVWTGQPIDPPDVLAEAGMAGTVTIFASWNGATEVASWQVLAGPEAAQLQQATSAPRDGFETTIPVESAEPYFAVQALDASGSVLGTSEAVQAVG